MKEPKFLPLQDKYLRGLKEGTERAFEKTMIAGWEKRHYIPDAYRAYADLTENEKCTLDDRSGPEFHFLNGLDKTVYIAPNEEFVLLVTRQDDVVGIEFILDEDSQSLPRGSGFIISDAWARAVAIKADLDNIEAAHAPIFAVSALPDLNSLVFNTYYLVYKEQSATLYYVDTYEKTVLEIEPRADMSTAFEQNKARLLEAVLGQNSRGVAEILLNIMSQIKNAVPNTEWTYNSSYDFRICSSGSGYNTKISFQSWPNRYESSGNLYPRKFNFTKLVAALDVFKRHCRLSDDVIHDVRHVLDGHKERFFSHKEWLANRLNEDPHGMLLQIKGIINANYVGTSIVEHFFSIIRWYAEHGCVDTAILLQKAMPSSRYIKETYIEVAQYIKELIMKDENVGTDRRAYLERLSAISLALAEVTQDKQDLIFGLRILTELSGGDGFSPDLDVDQPHSYLNLLVTYASQVGRLKEEVKALQKPVAALALTAAPRAIEPKHSVIEGRPRRNSFP